MARAQQRDRMRRIGFLTQLSENDPEAQSFLGVFIKELARLGCSSRDAIFRSIAVGVTATLIGPQH